MSDLIVITYSTEAKAEEMRTKLLSLQVEYLIEITDAVIAVKREDGTVKLNQLLNTTASGAISGGFWGTLVGMIFMVPLLGTAFGAAAGAISGALTDYGINDAFMKDLAASIQPGSAALFVLVARMTDDKVFDAIAGTGGTVLKTSLDRSKEQALRDAISGAHHDHLTAAPPVPPPAA